MKHALGVMLLSAIVALDAGPGLAQTLDTLKSNKVLIHDVQTRLDAEGFDVGGLDGSYGGRTGRAFEAFIESKGLSDAPLAEQLLALGIDLAALDRLTLTPIDNNVLRIDNGLPNGIPELHYQYDWKSFDVGRYRVTAEGEEVFTLPFDYCNSHGRADDCRTERARVQVQDPVEEFAARLLYSFEVMVESVPDTTGRNFQLAELFQNGGIKSRHPETGEAVDFSPRFTLAIADKELAIQDSSLIDVNLFGGQEIEAAKLPLEIGRWYKVDLEVAWSDESDGLVRYWVDGVALWERTGRNTTCNADGSTRGCRLAFKYGPYISHISQQWGELAETSGPIVIRFRNLTRTSGDAVAEVVAGLPMDFKIATAREGGPTPEAATLTSEIISHTAGKEVPVNTLLKTIIRGAKEGENEVSFNVQGQYNYPNDRFSQLRFVINEPLGKEMPEALRKCPVGEKTTVYDDGLHRLVVTFKSDGNIYTAREGACLLSAVVGTTRFMLDYLLSNFDELATDMAATGTAAALQNEGLRSFMLKVARGEAEIRAE